MGTGTASQNIAGSKTTTKARVKFARRRKNWLRALAVSGLVIAILLASGAWLATRAATVRDELTAATKLVEKLKSEIAGKDTAGAISTVNQLRSHTAIAKQSVEDPLWRLASAVPEIGSNFAAVTAITQSADDVARLGLAPLAKVLGSLDWKTMMPSGKPANLGPLQSAAPSMASAAHAVRASAVRLDEINPKSLWPQVAEPLMEARSQLLDVTDALDASADVARLSPGMMGSDGPRNYLLMVQNNAELRASGGIPGALAVLKLDQGKLSLARQGSASEIGAMSPSIPMDEIQRQIYSSRLGKYMQDVNLTPDFPTAASTASAMWERHTSQHVSGVVSVDPIALSYLLDATGPVRLSGPEFAEVASLGLPVELNSKNVVPTLLSDVYDHIEDPALQDAYFAGVAQEVFRALSNGGSDPAELLAGISRGVSEQRISLWSSLPEEQSILRGYSLSGSIDGPSIPSAEFAAYFNDGTGAKMDFYVKRTVQLIKACPRDGYEEVTVRITSKNTAPKDAATTLPPYVTGDGIFGVPPGSVQTNVIAYGPVQAEIESAKIDGKKSGFAPYLHSNRPVGVLAIRLAPGETKTVEYTFGKIVQHTEPNLVVTPTVQPVKDVVLPTVPASCG